MSITRNFKLFLTAGRSIPLLINANQYDHGETWVFTLYDESGQKYTPSSGAIVGIKADGYVILNAATVNAAGQVVVTETEQMTAAAGKAVFELIIDNQTHGTANFVVLIEPKPGDQGIVSSSDLSLLQQAIDSTNPAAIAHGVSDWMDDHLAPEEWVIDDTLTVEGAAADAKATGDAIAEIAGGSGLTNEVKLALLACLEKLGWTVSNGQDYYDALELAMSPPAELSYITAVYDQDGKTVYDTDSLDSLKSDLVVTAHYSDSSTATVTTYTLSGTLTTGTSTITVSYGGKTTTFTVTVTHSFVPSGYTAYDYFYRTAGGTQINKSNVVLTKKYDNLNALIVDFDFMPLEAKTSASSILGGNSSGTSSSNAYIVAFYCRTDTNRVSAWSHGTALAKEGVSSVAVNSKTHVNLNPHASSPSLLTVGSLTDEQAWTNTNTINMEFSFHGTVGVSNITPVANIAVGTLKIYDLTNTLLNEYIPCVRNADNVIGVYDTVEGAFYTASTVAVATIGNSSCVYAVGNWS